MYLWPIYIKYSSTELINPFDNFPSLVRCLKRDTEIAQELVDLLAYSLHIPLFLEVKSKKLNEYLAYLYENPIFEETGEYSLRNWIPDDLEIENRVSSHSKSILSLYNTALKQPEPLAKCIFLYRIIEYFYENIINQRNKPTEIEYLNNLYKLSKTFRYIPILKIDRLITLKGMRTKYINIISVWRTKTNYYLEKYYSQNPEFNLGNEIYCVGRCGSAHGGGKPNRILRQEDIKDYRRVQVINMFLELIIRFLIESNVPATYDLRVLNDRRLGI